jgi:hypothetical protein
MFLVCTAPAAAVGGTSATREPASVAVRPEPVSPWWWLLPPVMWFKQVQRNKGHQEQVLHTLSAEQVEALMSYSAKSTGWFLVGAGGFLIAVKETYELVETLEWATYLMWVLILVAAFLSVLNAVFRMRRGQQVVTLRRAAEEKSAGTS